MKEFVYLMKNLCNGYYKIGLSTDPKARERTLQAEEPDIVFLAAVDGNRVFEKMLHDDYKKFRVRGEWFSVEGHELWNLGIRFGLDIREVDPASQVLPLKDDYEIHVHRYGGRRVSSSVVCRRTGKWWLSVPWELRHDEALEQLECQQAAIETTKGFYEFLEASFRLIQVEEYCNSELIEARDRICGTPRGWLFRHNIPGFGGFLEHFFVVEAQARRYWTRQRNIVCLGSRNPTIT
jgi:hypothetical protein